MLDIPWVGQFGIFNMDWNLSCTQWTGIKHERTFLLVQRGLEELEPEEQKSSSNCANQPR